MATMVVMEARHKLSLCSTKCEWDVDKSGNTDLVKDIVSLKILSKYTSIPTYLPIN